MQLHAKFGHPLEISVRKYVPTTPPVRFECFLLGGTRDFTLSQADLCSRPSMTAERKIVQLRAKFGHPLEISVRKYVLATSPKRFECFLLGGTRDFLSQADLCPWPRMTAERQIGHLHTQFTRVHRSSVTNYVPTTFPKRFQC